MILRFGKYKGMRVEETPQNYQDWLNNQPWFQHTGEKPLHQKLRGWDGHSAKGQAVYDQIFEQEKAEGDDYDNRTGWYKPGGMYYGID
jgi:hypothetical protein